MAGAVYLDDANGPTGPAKLREARRRCLPRLPARWLLAAAAIAITLSPCSGQRYTFKQYVDGLGNLNVNCMFQDRTGFLWIGTQNGLYRYDGSRFQEFGLDHGLEGTFIHALHQDAAGRLWIGTTEGLFYMDAGQRIHPVLNGSKKLRVRWGSGLSSLPGGTVLAVTSRTLFAIDPADGGRSWKVRALADYPASPAGQIHINSVLAEPDGSVLFGCGTELCKIDGERRTAWGVQDGLPADDWRLLLRDRQGQLWVRGSSHIAVLARSAKRFEVHDLPGQPLIRTFMPLAEDAQGRILMSVQGDLARYDRGKWRVFTPASGLSGDAISWIFVDREGSVWLGLVGGGLRKWLGYDGWEHWTTANGLRSNVVWAVTRDRTGRLWIGDETGITTIPPGSTEPRPWNPPGIPTHHTPIIRQSKDGFVWIVTGGDRLVRVSSSTLRATPLNIADVTQILVDSSDRIWVTTLEGLFLSEPDPAGRTFHQVKNAIISSTDFVDVSEGPDGLVWLASNDAIFRYDAHAGWAALNFSGDRIGGHIWTMTADRSGGLWLSGGFPGLAHLDLDGLRVNHVERVANPPLASGNIVFADLDRRGWLWVGNDRGLDIFDGRHWHRCTQEDGLIWNDMSSRAFFEDRDGTVWLGTGGGLSHLLKPESLLRSAPPPKPEIVSAGYGSNAVPEGAGLEWRPDPLTISFASLTFRNEKAVSFRYRLSGLETNWMETTDPQVRYASLEPGSYVFEAQAVDGSSSMRSAIRTLPFRIAPPWWRTWLFQLAVVVTGLALAIVAWRWHIRTLIARSERLEVLVAQRTEELDRKLAQEASLNEKLQRYSAQLADSNDELKRFTYIVSHDLRAPLLSLKGFASELHYSIDRLRRPVGTLLANLDEPERAAVEQALQETVPEALGFIESSVTRMDNLISALLRLSRVGYRELHIEELDARELLEETLRTLAHQIESHKAEVKVGPLPRIASDRTAMAQIFGNLLDNAVKYLDPQRPGRIEVSARGTAEGAVFEVRDNGRGIAEEDMDKVFAPFRRAGPQDVPGEGVGLAYVRALLNRLGGRIECRSQPGVGTTFSFTLPTRTEPRA